ncbi:MAG: hypothetical protein IKH26_14000 [Bacteroidaceae bacterium]|nr:hypothetical protein [Bacteroidaceae bacterium]
MNNPQTISPEELRQSVRVLRNDFYLMVASIVVFVILGETGLLPNGLLTDSPSIDYAVTVAGVILALGNVYLGLKLFAKYTKDRVFVTSHYGTPLSCYRNLSLIRLSLLVSAACFNIIVYYLSFNANCLLMSFVPLVALFFCWPSRDKLENFIGCLSANDEADEKEDYNRQEEISDEYRK